MNSAAATARTNIYRPTIRPTRNPITKGFHWASKTDPNIIPLCGWWTRQTQAALGFFVLFTATLALFSGTYTLTTLNVPPPFNFLLGGLWGVEAGHDLPVPAGHRQVTGVDVWVVGRVVTAHGLVERPGRRDRHGLERGGGGRTGRVEHRLELVVERHRLPLLRT